MSLLSLFLVISNVPNGNWLCLDKGSVQKNPLLPVVGKQVIWPIILILNALP